jgi:hypothetical protein
MQQFMSENQKTKERIPHIYVMTNKRVVELDYNNPQLDKGMTVVTLKQLKAAQLKATDSTGEGK